MLQDSTEGAEAALAEGPITAYIGFDPTAASLHVGSLMPIMGLVHLQRAGHHPLVLVGGGTGLIGDPSGKTEERQLLTKEKAAENLAGMCRQLEHFLDFDGATNPARTVDNLDWLGEITMVDFLRDVGKHFSVNALLKKESIRRRVENEKTGISYTEFSYALLQGVRLRGVERAVRMHTPNGRQRSVGKHHSGHRSSPSSARGEGIRHHVSPLDGGRWAQVR